MIGFELQCLLDVLFRGWVVAHEVMQGGTAIPAFGVLRRLLDETGEGGEGRLEILARHLGRAGIKQGLDRRILVGEPVLPDFRFQR